MMTRNAGIGMAAAVLFGLLGGNADARLYEVTTSVLNVRSGPSKSSRVVKTLKRHRAINVVANKGDWKQINWPNKGWVHQKYVRSGLIRYVKASSLNIRRGPSKSAGVVKRLKKGTRVRVVALKGHWRQLSSPAKGWVHGKYLGIKKPGSGGSVRLGGRSRAGFVQQPRSARGIYWYCPISSHHWGTVRMITKILTMGRRTPRTIASGDISLPNGGYFPPHATHRDGRAGDFLPWGSYYNTQRFVNLMYSTGSISFILYNGGQRGVRWAYGHGDHLHMAIY